MGSLLSQPFCVPYIAASEGALDDKLTGSHPRCVIYVHSIMGEGATCAGSASSLDLRRPNAWPPLTRTLLCTLL